MTLEQAVLTQQADGVMLVTLNRPEKLNAMSRSLVDGLTTALTEANNDASVSVIVITGAGKAFCAGVDLQELSEGGSVLDDDAAMLDAFNNCRKPIVGAVNGAAITGGLEMALNCDFLYAANTARFGDTHAKVGLLPTWGMSQKLSRIIGINRAREMSLSGSLIDAQTAFEWGLVNKLCKPENLLDETLAKAREIAELRADAVTGIRALINNGWSTTLAEGLSYEDTRSRPFNDKVDFSVMSERLGQVKKSNR